jgi:hypothetical protein
LPRFPHLSVRLALKPLGPALPVAPLDEVASCPASCILRLCRRPSFRLPRLSRPLALPRVELQVAPLFAPSVAPLDAFPWVAPGFCIFRPCRRWIFESPRISHPSAHPAPKLTSFPAALLLRLRLPMHSASCPASCIFRLCRRRILELPRGSRPSAPLVLMPQVSLQHCSSSCASRCSRELPRFRTFRLCLGFRSPGCPESPLPWRRLMVSRVASVPASSGFAVPASSGCPESCIYGWVNDDFPVFLELCILGLPADESSWSIGRSNFPTDSGCILNLIQA